MNRKNKTNDVAWYYYLFAGAIIIAALMLAQAVLAGGPAPKTIASGSSSVLVALCDTSWTTESIAFNDTVTFDGDVLRTLGGYPTMIEIKAPSTDITYSFWDFQNPETATPDSVGTWIRLTGRHANSDTVGTLYSGDILRADERARFVYITREGASEIIVNRYY